MLFLDFLVFYVLLSEVRMVIYQKGEKVKSMAQGASEAVKNKLGMNSDKDNDYKNKNPLGRKNPNNTTCPSMPGHPPSDI